MTTLITDEFYDDGTVEATNLIYGADGWTDAVDDLAIALLLSIQAIRLDCVHSGQGWVTRIYVSVEGKA